VGGEKQWSQRNSCARDLRLPIAVLAAVRPPAVRRIVIAGQRWWEISPEAKTNYFP
jgi:hypothetical protein